MHNRFSILMICLMAQRPSARAGPSSGSFKGGHYKEIGAQIAPFVALARYGGVVAQIDEA
ncbi:hypothetical protein [Aeromonas enteropelogenes]|uniref:hypothetical protein n=1 Tax=Aeromonas enteropelogenes TaxID=29489 RepID=UPI000F531B94|nr:hypothetical protein [Aeromonas enteropelogenes]RQM70435.1 hypothetical protein EHZ64_01190 [Aeromonas enteropelogenes]